LSTGKLQLKDPAASATEACWHELGVQGNASCPRLQEVIHCRNCPVYAKAGAQLLDRSLLPEYRRACTEHFARKQALPAPDRISALLFRLGAEWLALPPQTFQEAAERRMVHSLPHRRQGIVLGLVNVRGELLLCVSLSHLLGLDGTSLREARRSTYDRLLVTNWNGLHFVFPVDEVCGIHRFQAPELTDPPATLAKSKVSYIQGVFQWQNRTVGLLDAARLFSHLDRNLT